MAASTSDSIANNDYEIRASSIIGAGKGMFATRPIVAGDCAIAEGSLCTASYTLSTDGRLELKPGFIEDTINNLTGTELDSFLELYGSNKYHKWAINEFLWSSSGSYDDTVGVFPTISRVNHSCVPNTEFGFSGGLGKIRAKQDIAGDEEIFISYKINMSDNDDRRKRHKLLKYFECHCYACERNMTIGQVRRERE